MDDLWNFFFENREKNEKETLGPLSGYAFRFAPRNLLFMLARYKFCAKMLAGKQHVLEIGCGDGTGVPIMLQCVDRMTCVDMNASIIEDNLRRFADESRVSFLLQDQSNPIHDAAIALDVLEHIPHTNQDSFMKGILASMQKNAVVIMGIPNITAFKYQNNLVKKYHINMQSHENLKSFFQNFFENTFIFSMNDEIVHTGFYPMANYLFVVGVDLR